tara:strand:+ start:1261 stop:1458 length:198 start_codon:yes stop_codon:yes gene_type:complete
MKAINIKLKRLCRYITNTICRIITISTLILLVSLWLASKADYIAVNFQMFSLQMDITKIEQIKGE